MSDPRTQKLKVRAGAYLVALLNGKGRTAAAYEAARAVDAFEGKAKVRETVTWKANARRDANTKPMKAYLAELSAPRDQAERDKIEATKEWATSRLVSFASEDPLKPDPIGALKLLAEMHGWKAPEEHKHSGAIAIGVTDEQRAKALEVFLAKNQGHASAPARP